MATPSPLSSKSFQYMKNKDLIKELHKRVGKLVGKKCPDFYYDCWICKAWVGVNIMEDVLDGET